VLVFEFFFVAQPQVTRVSVIAPAPASADYFLFPANSLGAEKGGIRTEGEHCSHPRKVSQNSQLPVKTPVRALALWLFSL
jgi:hypothetical protein